MIDSAKLSDARTVARHEVIGRKLIHNLSTIGGDALDALGYLWYN